jgi:hypothetical protein
MSETLDPVRRKKVIALLLGIWIYSLILWGYIVVDSFLFPVYQTLPISKDIPIIPQNLIADIAFPLSFVCFVLWAYLREQPGS